MAELDSGRKRAEQLAIRRIDLQIMRHEASIVESEIEIEQKLEEVERYKARIGETQKQIEGLRVDRETRMKAQGETNG